MDTKRKLLNENECVCFSQRTRYLSQKWPQSQCNETGIPTPPLGASGLRMLATTGHVGRRLYSSQTAIAVHENVDACTNGSAFHPAKCSGETLALLQTQAMLYRRIISIMSFLKKWRLSASRPKKWRLSASL